MAIRFQCNACGKTLQVADTAAGKKARCPTCQNLNEVPGTGTPEKPPQAPAASRSPAAASRPNAGAPETMQISCTACGKGLRVAASSAGKRVKCPSCQTVFSIPGRQRPASGPSSATAPQPVRPRPAATGKPRSKPRPAEDPFAPAAGGAAWDSLENLPTGPVAWQQPAHNPYAAGRPAAQGGFSAAPRGHQGRSPTQYIVAGVLIASWGGLVVLSTIYRIALVVIAISNLPAGAQINQARLSGIIIGMLLGGLLGVVYLLGGIAMARRTNLSLSKTAAAIAAVPCCGVLAFPVGIWACVLLFSDQAKRDFTD